MRSLLCLYALGLQKIDSFRSVKHSGGTEYESDAKIRPDRRLNNGGNMDIPLKLCTDHKLKISLIVYDSVNTETFLRQPLLGVLKICRTSTKLIKL